MKYSTILAMPDSYEKFNKLENKLLKLQITGGPEWCRANEEWKRLFKKYQEEGIGRFARKVVQDDNNIQ